jgi:hypothetical protein
VELTHYGEDCTFETLIKRARCVTAGSAACRARPRSGSSRRQVPERGGAGNRRRHPRAARRVPDDHQVLAQGMSMFEGLYATTSKKA